MIKVGDKVKGFVFDSYGGSNHWNYRIFEGIEGTVTRIKEEQGIFCIEFPETHPGKWYPIDEYLKIQSQQREEKLKELGI